jgi:predicted nucleotidyltransferase
MTASAIQAQDLAGVKEAAAIFGVRTQNFLRDWAKRPDFPVPVATLAATPVWRREDLVRYRSEKGPIRWPRRRRSLPLSPEARKALPVMTSRLVERFDPDRIVLFGSQVRGDATRDSDIDLLVVMPEITDGRELRVAMRVALHDVPVPKDIFVTTEAGVRRYGDLVGTILRPALREGVTIYARP